MSNRQTTSRPYSQQHFLTWKRKVNTGRAIVHLKGLENNNSDTCVFPVICQNCGFEKSVLILWVHFEYQNTYSKRYMNIFNIWWCMNHISERILCIYICSPFEMQKPLTSITLSSTIKRDMRPKFCHILRITSQCHIYIWMLFGYTNPFNLIFNILWFHTQGNCQLISVKKQETSFSKWNCNL